MDETETALMDSSCGQTVKDPERVDHALTKAIKCPNCRHKVVAHFREFVDLFAKNVDQAIANVYIQQDIFFYISDEELWK